LGRISDPRAADALQRAVNDPDPGVRWQVVRALGRIADQRTLTFLRPLLDDQSEVFDTPIAEAAQKAIETIKQRENQLMQRTVKASHSSDVERPR
jgi:HEAT repeat protein